VKTGARPGEQTEEEPIGGGTPAARGTGENFLRAASVLAAQVVGDTAGAASTGTLEGDQNVLSREGTRRRSGSRTAGHATIERLHEKKKKAATGARPVAAGPAHQTRNRGPASGGARRSVAPGPRHQAPSSSVRGRAPPTNETNLRSQ